MSDNPEWLFNECVQAGIDYTSDDIAADYDRQHEGFRDFEEEARKVAEDLGLSGDSVVLDIGCGTGNLSVRLAGICGHVYAVDVSAAMVVLLQDKVSGERLNNVTAVQGGFLTYEHEGPELDAIISNIALHHLPDFWKQVALCRLFDLLKPGGKLFLADVVFGFRPQDYRTAIDGWLGQMRELAGPEMGEETVVHVRDEFSTWDWVMEGMLGRAGFHIDSRTETMPNMAVYICSKV